MSKRNHRSVKKTDRSIVERGTHIKEQVIRTPQENNRVRFQIIRDIEMDTVEYDRLVRARGGANNLAMDRNIRGKLINVEKPVLISNEDIYENGFIGPAALPYLAYSESSIEHDLDILNDVITEMTKLKEMNN